MAVKTTPKFPTKLNKVIQKKKIVASLILDKMKNVNKQNPTSVSNFCSWLTGVTTMENDKLVKKELVKLRVLLKEYEQAIKPKTVTKAKETEND